MGSRPHITLHLPIPLHGHKSFPTLWLHLPERRPIFRCHVAFDKWWSWWWSLQEALVCAWVTIMSNVVSNGIWNFMGFFDLSIYFWMYLCCGSLGLTFRSQKAQETQLVKLRLSSFCLWNVGPSEPRLKGWHNNKSKCLVASSSALQ